MLNIPAGVAAARLALPGRRAFRWGTTSRGLSRARRSANDVLRDFLAAR